MKKYVIAVTSEGVTKYVFIDTVSGISRGVDTKEEATVMPSHAFGVAVVTAIRPAIKRQKINCVIRLEPL